MAVGDLLVASGADDGTAVSVALAEQSGLETRLIVGRALEGSGSAGEARVMALVGLAEAVALTASRETPRGCRGTLVPYFLPRWNENS